MSFRSFTPMLLPNKEKVESVSVVLVSLLNFQRRAIKDGSFSDKKLEAN